ncbi:MAG: hypothetical protein KGI93_08995 [Acidobacteriota bacterium]|nr:hypothetical protein [Acidobacteriota bacterium]MDE3191469.1 hypothetical protein [Acidobacteriota bacterium]
MRARRVTTGLTLSALATALALVAAPAAGAAAGSHLTLGGSVHGSVVVLRAVCNTHVATAKHKYFFDIGGTVGGQTFLMSGDVAGYTGPHTYHSFSGLVMAAGRYFTGHGAGAGSVTVLAGGNGGALRLTVKQPAGAGGGTETVSGTFTCTAYTTV